MSAPDPKPQKRRKADANEWALLRLVKLSPCRICSTSYGLELHHLVSRSLGGDDEQDNLVSLCRRCHGAVEDHSGVACSLLRERLSLAEIAYVVDHKGVDYLERRYPDLSASGGEERSAA